uniref:GPI inositol-deacylase n=1 Tax=Globodera pallida TaxID=36090 RepID=A0A183CCF5_GLOPA
MTYMWRRIFYLDVGLKHKAYSLFLYAEGLNRAQRYGELGQLDGFPIVFVPGNAGSGRQVRSLGSLLQNKTERLGTPFQFDTFALDFNEEMTALNFDYVESQAQFLSDSIDHILSLYSSPHISPPKIVLIGHSMGGIVIQKLLATDSKFDKRQNIAFVVAFATPFAQPPFMFDKRFLRFWNSMNSLIEGEEEGVNRRRGESAFPNIVSVSGGLLDEFIDEGWTFSPAVNVHAHSAAIDRIWAEADHLCIVWCNELVRQTSRFLFDYAAAPTHFLQNFHDFAHLHYHSLGVRLSPISPDLASLSDVNIMSGGLLDEFIDEGWTFSPAVNVHAHSAAIDRIWAEADHLCIVWCNELVRQTSRFLFDYAAAPTHFLQNFHDFAHLHYHSLGVRLSPISPDLASLSDVNISLCVPKCPINSEPQQIDLLSNTNDIPSIGKHRFLLAIAHLNDRNHLSSKVDLLTLSNCGQSVGARFLDSAHLFAFFNLSNCVAQGKVLIAGGAHLWVFDDDAILLPQVHLSFIQFLWNGNKFTMTNFSMEKRPLAIVPIHFPRKENEFGIFKVQIWRRKCREKSVARQRIVFLAGGVPRRFDKFGTDSNSSALFIYPPTKGRRPNFEDTGDGQHHQLMIIDTAQCAEYSLVFSVDLHFSLIKLFRRSQHFLPASSVLTLLLVHFYVSTTTGRRHFMNLCAVPVLMSAAIAFVGTDVFLLLLAVNSAAFLFFHLLLLTVSPFVLALFRPFGPFASFAAAVAHLRIILFLLLALSTAFTNNSFPLALFCVCLHISALHRRFASGGNAIAFSAASLLLILPSVVFQFPHIFTCAWNVAKFGQFRALSDPFLATNLTLSLFTLSSHFRNPIKLFGIS